MQPLVRADMAQERIEARCQLVPGTVRQQLVECNIAGRARNPDGVVAASRIFAICTGEARMAANRAIAGSSTMRNSITSSAFVSCTTTSPLRMGGSLRRIAGRGSSEASRILSSARRSRWRLTFSCSANTRSEGSSSPLPNSARICVISLRMSLETSGCRVRAMVVSLHIVGAILDSMATRSQYK